MTGEFSHEHLRNVLYNLEDFMHRSSIFEYAVTGNILKLMLDSTLLEGNKIELGMRKRDVSQHSLDILKMLTEDFEQFENEIKFVHNSVPVTLRFYDDGGFFDHLDVINYLYDSYKIPNPIKEYLKTI